MVLHGLASQHQCVGEFSGAAGGGRCAVTDALALLWPALVVAICLVGIHTYFGIEVLRRKVIFVDLALAQIAALGATVSVPTLDGTPVRVKIGVETAVFGRRAAGVAAPRLILAGVGDGSGGNAINLESLVKAKP